MHNVIFFKKANCKSQENVNQDEKAKKNSHSTRRSNFDRKIKSWNNRTQESLKSQRLNIHCRSINCYWDDLVFLVFSSRIAFTTTISVSQALCIHQIY